MAPSSAEITEASVSLFGYQPEFYKGTQLLLYESCYRILVYDNIDPVNTADVLNIIEETWMSSYNSKGLISLHVLAYTFKFQVIKSLYLLQYSVFFSIDMIEFHICYFFIIKSKMIVTSEKILNISATARDQIWATCMIGQHSTLLLQKSACTTRQFKYIIYLSLLHIPPPFFYLSPNSNFSTNSITGHHAYQVTKSSGGVICTGRQM